MPILRLVLTYLFLTLAVVAVFNRDKLSALVFGAPPQDNPVAAAAPAVEVAPAPAPAPTDEAVAIYAPTADAAPAAVETDLAEALDGVRATYWSNGPAAAETQLAALAAAHPDNADLLGELGNLHFSQRNYPAAADDYLKAAQILIAEGRGAQAGNLLPVLQQIDPAKAMVLAEQLNARNE